MARCMRSMSYDSLGISGWKPPPSPSDCGNAVPTHTDIPRPRSNDLPRPQKTTGEADSSRLSRPTVRPDANRLRTADQEPQKIPSKSRQERSAAQSESKSKPSAQKPAQRPKERIPTSAGTEKFKPTSIARPVSLEPVRVIAPTPTVPKKSANTARPVSLEPVRVIEPDNRPVNPAPQKKLEAVNLEPTAPLPSTQVQPKLAPPANSAVNISQVETLCRLARLKQLWGKFARAVEHQRPIPAPPLVHPVLPTSSQLPALPKPAPLAVKSPPAEQPAYRNPWAKPPSLPIGPHSEEYQPVALIDLSNLANLKHPRAKDPVPVLRPDSEQPYESAKDADRLFADPQDDWA